MARRFFPSERKQKVVEKLWDLSVVYRCIDDAVRLLRPLRPLAYIHLVNVLESLDKSGNSKRVGKNWGGSKKCQGGGK